MALELTIPKLGLTMDEGKIVGWRKKVGEKVAKGEPLFEVETDKAVVEVESPAEGVLRRITMPEGETGRVGAVVGYLEAGGEVGPAGDRPYPSAAPATAGRRRSSPLARKLARQWKVDLATTSGTGPGGRILKRDVLRAREAPVPQPPESPPPVSPKGRVPVGRMRKAVADRMLHSTTHAPQFFVAREVDVSRTLADLEALNAGGRGTVKVNLLDVLVYQTARLLMKYPEMNSYYIPGRGLEDTFIEYHEQAAVAIAVALTDGLIVPVLHRAEARGLLEVAATRADLVQRARENKLTAEELQGGTFSISNLGPMGVDFFHALLNPPEAGILAVGQVRRQAVVRGDGIAIRPMVVLVLTVDHRLIDGATAAAFLGDLAGALERGRKQEGPEDD